MEKDCVRLTKINMDFLQHFICINISYTPHNPSKHAIRAECHSLFPAAVDLPSPKCSYGPKVTVFPELSQFHRPQCNKCGLCLSLSALFACTVNWEERSLFLYYGRKTQWIQRKTMMWKPGKGFSYWAMDTLSAVCMILLPIIRGVLCLMSNVNSFIQ